MLGDQWFTEIAASARAQGLSLTCKTFDHAYDSLNLYTYHASQLAAILAAVYPLYAARGLFHATPHFLQGVLPGINPDHIGWVQEPAAAYDSHSGRMGRIGRSLDGAPTRRRSRDGWRVRRGLSDGKGTPRRSIPARFLRVRQLGSRAGARFSMRRDGEASTLTASPAGGLRRANAKCTPDDASTDSLVTTKIPRNAKRPTKTN